MTLKIEVVLSVLSTIVVIIGGYRVAYKDKLDEGARNGLIMAKLQHITDTLKNFTEDYKTIKKMTYKNKERIDALEKNVNAIKKSKKIGRY